MSYPSRDGRIALEEQPAYGAASPQRSLSNSGGSSGSSRSGHSAASGTSSGGKGSTLSSAGSMHSASSSAQQGGPGPRRRRVHSFDRHLKEAALERSAVGIVVARVLDDGRPVAQRLVPDYRREDLMNPFVAEILREGSCRLEECLPESYRTASAAARKPLVPPSSMSPYRGGGAEDELNTSQGSGSSGGSGSTSAAGAAAEMMYMGPEASGALADCCYFILYLGDTPPPSTNPFDDDPDLFPPPSAALESEEDEEGPTEGGSSGEPGAAASTGGAALATATPLSPQQKAKSPRVMSLRRRKRRIYGIARRSPNAQQPYCVVLLSAVPCFGLLRHQFMSLTSAYFARGCRDEAGDLRAFLLAAANPTTGILHREVMAHNPDVPVMWLVTRLGIEHVLGLVKLLLLEGRLLFYSSQASQAASAVLALVSLLPGGYHQALEFQEGPSMAVSGYRWRKFGLPLRIFHQESFLLQPLLVMAQAERTFAKFQGFLVGTSDPLISKLHAAKLDAIVDLDACSIDSQRFLPLPHTYAPVHTHPGMDVGPTTGVGAAAPLAPAPPSRASSSSLSSSSASAGSAPAPMEPPSPSALLDLARVSFEYGPADADFLDEVLASLPAKHSPLSPAETEASAAYWNGSDAWIRKHFQVYFEGFLGRAAHALHTTIRDGALAERLSGPPASASGWVRKAVTGLLNATPRIPGGGFGFDVKLMDYNRAWVGQWTTTLNFRLWHDLYPLPCLQEALEREQRGGPLVNDGSNPTAAAPCPPDGQVNYTYPNGDAYQGEMKGGKRHGRGTYIEHATGNTYEGEWRRDLRHGKGILTTGASDFLYDGEWRDDKREGRGHCTIRGRETYTGQFLASKFHGQGKLVDADGTVYEGEWVAGRRQGAGTLRGVDGEVYVGEWREGQRHGLGTCQYPDGSHYTGEWAEGKRSGEGAFVSADGSERYEGLWEDDQRHGFGVLRAGSGDVLEGEWYQGRPKDGEWRITYGNGDQFAGQCRDGRPHGQGTCKYVNADVYTGGWEDGLRAGPGVCVYASGETFEGHWACNQPVEPTSPPPPRRAQPPEPEGSARPRRRRLQGQQGPGQEPAGERPTPPEVLAAMSGPECRVVYRGSGDTYVGALRLGKRHGKGVYHERATGNRYEGEFVEDRRHGTGVLSSGSRDFVYEGEWVADRRTGQGHCVLRGKEAYSGQWLDDRFHGKGKYVDAVGNTYEGEWVHGRREGAGTLTRTDGEVYVGEWRGGEQEGLGQCQYPDGACYSGEWHAGKWNGEGVLVSASGDKHEGLWSGGKRCGWGVWTSPTGDVVEGEWYQDEPKDGEWKITYSNGDQFVGQCQDGQPEGPGICKYANGAVYSGEWSGGQRAGWGKCVFANGEVYDGLWERDHVSLRGQGTLSFQDGRVHEFM